MIIIKSEWNDLKVAYRIRGVNYYWKLFSSVLLLFIISVFLVPKVDMILDGKVPSINELFDKATIFLIIVPITLMIILFLLCSVIYYGVRLAMNGYRNQDEVVVLINEDGKKWYLKLSNQVDGIETFFNTSDL